MKKVPMRKCIGCMISKPKKELLRIVKNKDGEIFVDTTGKANGRGAYICKSMECFNKMVKQKRLSKTFEESIDDKTYERISGVIENSAE